MGRPESNMESVSFLLLQLTQALLALAGVRRFDSSPRMYGFAQLVRQAIQLATIAYGTITISINPTCRKSPHKLNPMEKKTAITCNILTQKKIMIRVGLSSISADTRCYKLRPSIRMKVVRQGRSRS